MNLGVDHIGKRLRELADGQVLARPNVHVRVVAVVLHQKQQRLGQVIHMQKFPSRITGTPYGDRFPSVFSCPVHLCFVKFSD